MDDRSLWEEQAGWWQQGFTDGADPEYEEQILPLIDQHIAGSRRVLDIGCGEGQAARRLTAMGAEVIGLDPTPAQLRLARERAGGPAYAHAIAEALPCRSRSFDAVVMCLVIEHIEAYEATIHEVARVLEPGGRFLLLLNHPLLQAPGAAGSTITSSRSSTGGSGRTSATTPGSRKSPPASTCPSCTAPSVDTYT